MNGVLLHIDAFAERPFTGNPAAVCLRDTPADTDWMQALAREMNLPATAILWPEEDCFTLRWFSPAAELTLCGHGTLAAAHALRETGKIADGGYASFATHSGRLSATVGDGWVELDFPSEPAEPAQAPAALIEALGVTPRFVGRNRLDYLVELDSEAAVRALAPDLACLRDVETRGVIVTSRAQTPGFDIVSRFFAPRFGIGEDAVTGSAHCCLGPYWSSRLGTDQLIALQASARTGVLRVRIDGARVLLRGRAITIRR